MFRPITNTSYERMAAKQPPDGNGQRPSTSSGRVCYRWSIVSRPAESQLAKHDLWSSRTPEVSFLPDVPGEYVLCFKQFYQGKVFTDQVRIWVEKSNRVDQKQKASAADANSSPRDTTAVGSGTPEAANPASAGTDDTGALISEGQQQQHQLPRPPVDAELCVHIKLPSS